MECVLGFVALGLIFTLQAVTAEAKSCYFIKQPLNSNVVRTQDLEVFFECQFRAAENLQVVSYDWFINGEVYGGVTNTVRGITSPPYLGGPVYLIVTTLGLSEHDNNTIQCEADIRRPSGARELYRSGIAIIQVQGPLDPVTNLIFDTTLLSNTSIMISWTAPFSLNLTTAEPDIQYCVDVYNVTGGEDNHIHSECNITDTSYTFPASDPDQLFNFTVTPRSNVEGSLNGTTSQPVQGFVCRDQHLLNKMIAIEFKGAVDSSNKINATLVYHSPQHQHVQNGKVCPSSSTALTITLVSSVGGYSCVLHPTMSGGNTNVIMSISSKNCARIIRHHLYKLTVREVYYDGGSTTTEKIISTHDVQNPELKVSTSNSIHVNISCTFLKNTRDLGFLVIVNSAYDFLYLNQYRGEENSTSTHVQITGLEAGSYNVSVYDLESDGLPQHTPAAQPLSFTTQNVNNSYSHTDEPPSTYQLAIDSYNVASPEGDIICLTCLFPPKLTGCVGVFHDAQLVSTLTVLTVDHSNDTNCSNGWTEGLYGYAVFGQLGVHLEEVPAYKGSIKISQPPTSVTDNTISKSIDTSLVIIATGVSGFAAICLGCISITIGILCVLSKWQKQEKMITLDIQRNEAYSFPLKMNQNLAYETAHLGQSQAVSTEPHDYEEIVLPQASEPEYAEIISYKNSTSTP